MSTPSRLFNRNILLLWQGQLVSNLGNQAFLIALVFWIKDTTNSATLMGLVLMISGLIAVGLGPIGGTFADRYSRRNIIVICDLLAGIMVLALAAMLFFIPGEINLIITWIFITAAVLATVSAFFTPAISAAIPDLVPPAKIGPAISISQSILELAGLVGQALGGVLYRLIGAPLLMLFNGLSFLYSAASELFIRIPQRLPEQSVTLRSQLTDFRRDLVEGLGFIWQNKGLRGLVLLSALSNFFNVPIVVLLPFFVEDVLRLTPDWYGYLLALYSAGTLLGYLVAGTIAASGRRRATLAIACLFLEPLGYALIALVSTPVALLSIAGFAGLCSGFLIVAVTTVLQIATPSELRGRVFGLLGTISGTLAPIATGLAGIIADLTGQRITAIYLACSAAMLLLALAMALNGRIRTFFASEAVEDPADSPKLEPPQAGDPLAGDKPAQPVVSS